MNNQGIKSVLLKITFTFLLSSFLFTEVHAQVSQPQVWFRLNASDVAPNALGIPVAFAHIGSISLGLNDAGMGYTQDRFGNASSASTFAVNGYADVVDWTYVYFPPSKKLFGLGNIPENFTISCWVYVNPAETNITRKIFFGGRLNSEFSLMHKGSKIFLRRCVEYNNNKRFDYEFWSPASFDAGEGWYQVIFSMGKDGSGVKRTKLYIGKPSKMKYDQLGPRPVGQSTDPLDSNFGGGYALFGSQNIFNDLIVWGFGTHDNVDDVNNNILAVQKMDDFMIWDFVVTDDQAKAIFNCQKINDANFCFVQPQQTMRTGARDVLLAEDQASESKITDEETVIYPNPASNQLTVSLYMKEAGSVNLLINDLTGKILLQEIININKGRQEVTLENLKAKGLKSGIYILTIRIGSNQQNYKFIIQ